MNTGACTQYIITNHRSANVPELLWQQDVTDVNFLGVLYLEVKSVLMSTKELFLQSFHRNTTYVHTRMHCKTSKLSSVNLVIFENAAGLRIQDSTFRRSIINTENLQLIQLSDNNSQVFSTLFVLKIRLEHWFLVPGMRVLTDRWNRLRANLPS